MFSHPFRISIALEDEKSGGMKILAVHDGDGSNIKISDDLLGLMGKKHEVGNFMPSRIEATFFCTRATWLTIKNKSLQQGAQWRQAVSKIGQTYWSCKPKITVLEVLHLGALVGDDPLIHQMGGAGQLRLEGTIDDRVSQVRVRDPRPQNGLAIEGL